MSKRNKINRIEKRFDGRSYAESRKIPPLNLSDVEINTALHAAMYKMVQSVQMTVISVANHTMDMMLSPLEEYTRLLSEENEDELYTDDMPGMTLEEFQSRSDEVIREAEEND